MPDYVSYLIYGTLLVLLCTAFWHMRRAGGFAAPVPFVIACTILTMLVYLVNSQVDLPQERWFAGYDFARGCTAVVGISLYVSSAAIVAALYAGVKTELDDLPRISMPNIPAWADALGLLITSFLIVIYLWHFSVADFSNAMSYSEYLFSRSPDFYKLKDPVSIFAHGIRKPVGLVLSGLIPFLWLSRRYTQATILALPLLYIFFINLVEHSKFCMVYLVVMGLTLSFTKSKVGSWITMGIASLAGIAVFAISLLTRHERAYGLNSLFTVFGDLLNRGSQLKLLGAQFLHLVFGGGRTFEEAMTAPYSPTFAYKILSFSPLVSAVDGFDSTWSPGPHMAIHYWETPQGAIWAPLSGLAQLYHFGPIYIIGFWFFFTFALCLLQKAWITHKGILTLVGIGPFYLFIPMLFAYPLRNSFRMLLISLVLVTIAKRFQDRSNEIDSQDEDSEEYIEDDHEFVSA